MTGIKQRMAGIIGRHIQNPWGQHDGWWECACGEAHTPEHVADAINESLSFTLESDGESSRYVSDWESE